jgi:prepilin-type N-terminal cleavage/methylation domain-containing protein/prepilin-type processing-associated H-X9-DG protein
VKPRSAFTLIELLVVIAIIALLLSVLMPSLQQAKELARAMTCMTNMKALGAGWMFYANDFEEYCPPSTTYTPGGNISWRLRLPVTEVLDEYFGGQVVGDTSARALNNCDSTDRKYDYAMNNQVWSKQDTSLHTLGKDDWKKISIVESPSTLTVVADSSLDYFPTDLDALTKCWYGNWETIENAKLKFGNHHPGGFNALIFDGHVERLNDESFGTMNYFLLSSRW